MKTINKIILSTALALALLLPNFSSAEFWAKQPNQQLYTNSGNGLGNAVINVAGCNGCTAGGFPIGGTITGGTAGSVLGISPAATLAQSAVGTVGQALISGGTGVPTWFAPTAGSVIFAGTAGILAQDNANLFFDNTSNYLGIGTNTPASELHVVSVSASNPRGVIQDQITSDALGARYNLRKARGTPGALTTIVTGDVLGRVAGWGYDGSNYLLMGQISMTSSGTIAATRVPTDMMFSTGTNATPSVLTEAMRITNGQFVGIGTTSPASALQVATSLTTSPRGIMSSQHSDSTDGARFHMRKSRGTNAAPTVIVTGDTLGRMVGSGYDGTSYLEMASIMIGTEGTIATNRIPTNIGFYTATDASPSVQTEALRINSSQNVIVGQGELTATPVGGTIRSPIAVQQASTVAGADLRITASAAVAGSGGSSAGDGGDIIFTSGAANRITGGNGSGGDFTFNPGAGIGGSAITNARPGDLRFNGVAGASSSNGGGVVSRGSGIGLTAGAGGDNTSSTTLSVGGEGGNFNLVIGAGGNATGSTAGRTFTGGAGGALSVTLGRGGDAVTTTGNKVGGAGSPFTVTLGRGGDATSSTTSATTQGGKGSDHTFTTGNGGNATGVAGTSTATAGNGGDFTIATGTPGTASGANTNVAGTNGIIQFKVGGTSIANFGPTGMLIWNTDNTYDIGATGATRPRTGYFGTSLVSPLVTALHVSSGSTPTVSNTTANSCGTTAATIAGNDNNGIITVGATSGTSCTITFTTTAANRRECVVSNETTANLARGIYIDTTHSKIDGVFVAGDVLAYMCLAR